MSTERRYVGIHNEMNGGMTDTGKIIRDAWAFGLIPEEETCEGWNADGIETLWAQVQDKWAQYGYLVSQLPPDIQTRYLRIQEAAVKRARGEGWDPELGDDG